VPGLADAIAKVITAGDVRDQLVIAGRQRCEVFRPENVANKWISFIHDVVGRSTKQSEA
jgi:hypothetical protein